MKYDASAKENAQSVTHNLFPLFSPKSSLSVPLAILGKMLHSKDLIALHQAIETALPDSASRIVQFASCGLTEGTTQISMQLCHFAAATLGYRTLFVDVNPQASPVGANQSQTAISLIEAADTGAPLANAIARASGNGPAFDYAYLTAEVAASAILPHQEKIRQMLPSLREQYHLIIFHAHGILVNPIGVSLSRMADGVIIVVEAERTRAPAAKQAIQLLSEKDVSVMGMVFNKRRQYIPGWIYRWL